MKLKMTESQEDILKEISRSTQTAHAEVVRAKIILLRYAGESKSRIAKTVGCHRNTVSKWCKRWVEEQDKLEEAEKETEKKMYKEMVKGVLLDAERSGKPSKFTAEQVCEIIAVACQPPEELGYPITHWTPTELAIEVVKQGIVESISVRHIGRLLEQCELKPHRSQYWLTNEREKDPELFDKQVKEICDLYAEAAELSEDKNKHIISNDEKTGIQALERTNPYLPMIQGQVERREFEYTRHGTQALIASFDVATGTVFGTVGDTRTEEDYVAHCEKLWDTDPNGTWIMITDRLNIHLSESLVRAVAKRCGLEIALGIKGKSGILKSMATRQAFLSEHSHRIRFVYTPKHCSWLNQVEIWFSILWRRVLKRGHFNSKEALRQRLLDFISYFNRTLAKPFKWTYKGRPLSS